MPDDGEALEFAYFSHWIEV